MIALKRQASLDFPVVHANYFIHIIDLIKYRIIERINCLVELLLPLALHWFASAKSLHI